MKTLLLILLLFSCSQYVYAQDYWVYIRKQTKITDYDNSEQIAGFSDIGDIVEVLPVTPQYIPTEKELEIYKIIKVKDFKKLDRTQLKDTIRDIDDKTIKYRRHKIDISTLGIKEVFEKSEIQSKVIDKIDSLPIDFYTDK